MGSSCNERAVRVQQAHQRGLRVPATPKPKMGLEKEKSDTSVIMDEDEFNRSIEPILGKKPHVYSPVPDRDPKDINAHLKVYAHTYDVFILTVLYLLHYLCLIAYFGCNKY